MQEFAELLESGDKEKAMQWLDAAFDDDPGSCVAAFGFANLMLESGHPGPALFIFRELARQHPQNHAAWQNMARAYEEYDEPAKSIHALHKALKIKPDATGVHVGMSSAYTQMQDWPRALRWADKALQGGDSVAAAVNKGFALLATGDYGPGWDHYNRGIGRMTWRDKHDYGLEEWTGKTDGKVLVYAEQGIGDQIAFLSCLPEGMAAALNVAPKLENLLQDTFEDIPVFGDQFKEETHWSSSVGAKYQAMMSELPRFYRREAKDFPGTPYLKVNPAKKLQWQALLDSLSDKKKIGIAWTGGSRKSAGYGKRNIAFADFAPLREMDAEFINLEYKGPEQPESHNFPWATQTPDYSDTAALVSCLDAVVCVPTAVYHLAGALGVPAHVIAAERPHFHEELPWWESVTIHPRTKPIPETLREIRELL